MAAVASRLSYSGTNVDFGIGAGYERPNDPDRHHHIAGDGTTVYSYDFYTPPGKWIVPIVDTTKANADNLNSFWTNRRDCTWIPDYTNAPATTYTVRIMNTTQPMWFHHLAHFEAHYSGTLIFRVVA